MNLIASLQKDYEEAWKHIIRPPRTTYSIQQLGSISFTYQGAHAQRTDFTLTNSQHQAFSCSLWLPTNNQLTNCVLYLHGNTSNRLEGTQYLGRLILAGIGLCTFDFSGCGNADGQYISLGHNEREEVTKVVQHLRSNPRVGKLALWGRSMGAVTALLYLPQDSTIRSVVLDSPFKSLKSLIEDIALKNSKVPGFVLSAALKVISKTLKQKANFNLSDINPLKFGAPHVFIPAFFIVGVMDEVIPMEHTGELFEVYGGQDKTIKMINGGHNDNRPELTLQMVIQFINQHFQEDEEKLEHSLPETLDSNLQHKEESFSSRVKEQEMEVGEEDKLIKKQSFSFSNIFSFFSKRKEKQQSQMQIKREKVEIQQRKVEIQQRKVEIQQRKVEIQQRKVELEGSDVEPLQKKKKRKHKRDRKKNVELPKEQISLDEKE